MELVDGTDLGRGRGKGMERGRNGRREYRRGDVGEDEIRPARGVSGGGQDLSHEQGCAACRRRRSSGRCGQGRHVRGPFHERVT